jgi:ATP-dependent DNA helicase RecG
VPCKTRLVECVSDDGNPDEIVVINVETSDLVHSNKKDEVYLQVGDETRRLTFAQRQELLYHKGQSSFKSTAVSDAVQPDLDRALLNPYAEAVNHPNPERLLVARGLAKPSTELTAAAVLLFAAEPRRWFPEASLRIFRYRGTGARQQLLHDRRIDGPIPRQLHKARTEMLGLLPTRKALGRSGRFEEIGLIPQDAWLEAIVNAVVHRSYSISGNHIRVEIFDDRIEVESPSRFPGIVDISDPLHITRFARNPRIARVCADLAFGQELGEGVRRMFEEMRLAGLADPEYHQTSGSVQLALPSTAVDRELEARFPPGSRDLVRCIREGERVRGEHW